MNEELNGGCTGITQVNWLRSLQVSFMGARTLYIHTVYINKNHNRSIKCNYIIL